MRNKKGITILAWSIIACMIVTGFTFGAEKSFAATDISKATVKLGYTLATYTAKSKTPKVTLTLKGKTLKSGTDYSVTYKNNKNPGTAKVIITGKGDYSGSKTATFKIRVGSVKNLKASYSGTRPPDGNSPIKFTWTKSTYCSYYKITVTKDGKKFRDGTYRTKNRYLTLSNISKTGTYKAKVVAVGSPNKNVSSAKSKSITVESTLSTPAPTAYSGGYQRIDVSWKQVPGATGYYINETNNSTGKTITKTIDSGSTVSYGFQHDVGVKCSYTVQAFSSVNGKTNKSKVSKTVSATSQPTYIGQATQDENGNVRGGKAGDQNGREVAKSKWKYNSKSGKWNNWQYVARFNDPAKAELAAKAMEDACANDNIGYDQSARSELYNIAKSRNWDIAGITQKCETSCSPLVATCICASGITVPGTWTTANSSMRKHLENTGEFTFLTDSKYLTTDVNLKRGDILVSPSHHTAMVL